MRGALETPNASLVLLPRLLTDTAFRARITARITNPLTRDFFERQFNSWRDSYREEAIAPVFNKIDAFLFSPAIRNVIGQAAAACISSRPWQRRRVVIANLARGIIGETPSNLTGALLACPRPGRGHGARIPSARGANAVSYHHR